MPHTPSFNRAQIQLLIPRDRTLVGLGLRWPSDESGPVSTVWTATLPGGG